MRRRATTTLAASPVLIGVITVLAMTVAVFIAYNANQGLPFIPTYKIKMEVNDASGIVRNNEVKIAGFRVGFVSDVQKVRHPDGSFTAKFVLKLDRTAKPVYKNATYIVRQASTLGLKYVDLKPGSPEFGAVAEGGTLGLKQAKTPVELQDFFNIYDAKTRASIRASLAGWANTLAGRGINLNEAFQALRPLLEHAEPAAQTLAAPDTDLGGFLRAISRSAQIVAPAAPTFADLFVNLDITFAAFASAAPELQELIERAPATESVSTVALRRSRPFLRHFTQFAAELRPDARLIEQSAPDLAAAISAGTRYLPDAPAFNRRLETTIDTIERLVDDPNVSLTVDKARETFEVLNPYLGFVTPAQTTCNYMTLLFRNAASFLSEGSPGLSPWQRFAVVLAPSGTNNIGFPASRVANGPELANYLHANPYPNTAAPGQQPQECEAGKESYIDGKAVIGNVPGSQGTGTEGR